MSEPCFIVEKFGSDILTNGCGVDQVRINNYAAGLAERFSDGENLVVVTSGAVEAGRARVESYGEGIDSYSLRTLAQLGSATINQSWETGFENVNRMAGGLLVTHHELVDRSEGPKFLETLASAGDKNIVSIVNENDALSDVELMRLLTGGDNDGLARAIAVGVGAKRLEIFTRRGGIVDEQGELIPEVNTSNIADITRLLKARHDKQLLGNNGSSGRGGMRSKNKQCWRASRSGVESVVIAAPNAGMTGENVTSYAA